MCGFGKYKAAEGDQACDVCPDVNHSTELQNSTSLSDCCKITSIY